jgi:APA family basic amino acid/polyamine antiporter
MSQKIGFWSVFALVTGSQIGSGVFMLPASLAPYGLYSLCGWALSSLGAICLALVFAGLCRRFPKTGGPHAYVQEAFGPMAGFFTGWTYWIISWVSTTAVVVASIGYLMPLIGPQSPLVYLGLEIGLLVCITWLNLKGVKAAGSTEFVLTAIKIIPLMVLPLAAFFYFDVNNFSLSPKVNSLNISQILNHVTLLTLWGFIGLETATTPAECVENPCKTIPRAIILGTISVAILYILNSVAIMGVIPGNTLAQSTAPYVDATHIIFGGNWYLGVSLIASIICIGTLNAWMLASGQIALGLAQDSLMPEIFARKNKKEAPYLGLLVSCGGIIPLLIFTCGENLAKQVSLLIDFSVIAFLFVYMVCCFAFVKVSYKNRQSFCFYEKAYASIATIFCFWVLYEASLKTVLMASLFIITGIPMYFFMRKRKLYA